jgi:prolyl oligopeptidase
MQRSAGFRLKSWLVGIGLACLTLACGSSQDPARGGAGSQLAQADRPPAAEPRPVSNVYHGVTVVDPYQWLERDDDPEVNAWSNAQNDYARRYLDALPDKPAIHARLTELMTATAPSYWAPVIRGDTLFVMRSQPPREQPSLVVMDVLPDSPAMAQPDTARVIVDPIAMEPGGTISIDWFVPSPDGKLVALSLSRSGSERGDVVIHDVATGKAVHERIPHVNGGTAGGDVAWLPDSSGFFYTRYPRGDERPAKDHDFYQQVYFHELGTATERDRYELGKDLPRIAEIRLDMNDRTGHLLATVQNGDGGEFAHYLRAPGGAWTQVSQFSDKTVQVVFGPDRDLYAVSRKDAPRGKVLHTTLATPDFDKARVVIPQGEDTIVTSFWYGTTVLATSSRLYLVYQRGGPSELRVFELQGKRLPTPEQLPVSSVGTLVRVGKGDQILFPSSSFVEPLAFYHYDPATHATRKTALAYEPPARFPEVEVVRELATSRDGTKVPLNIIMPRGTKREGNNPTLVIGYGGYGLSLQPRFNTTNIVPLEQAMIIVVANLRGGGEYGAEWHEQGRLTRKQNVFDDFAAVLEHLIERGYTSSERLGIIGGSNGGLLMGATLVQRPELFRAVVSMVGIYDSLRTELSPNGEFNITEFGTVKDPDQFKALYAYSPYHNVKQGTAYPATLFTVGANDPRVAPWHSRKMTARLQAATSSRAPILLRVTESTGHGSGTPLAEQIAGAADMYAFLFAHLGVTYQRPARQR